MIFGQRIHLLQLAIFALLQLSVSHGYEVSTHSNSQTLETNQKRLEKVRQLLQVSNDEFYDFFNCLMSGEATTEKCTHKITDIPSELPSMIPTILPTLSSKSPPSFFPTSTPTALSTMPSSKLSQEPILSPSESLSSLPSSLPSFFPSLTPTIEPPMSPSTLPSADPTYMPSMSPDEPTYVPSSLPSNMPTSSPSDEPTNTPSMQPSSHPSELPTTTPSQIPSDRPSVSLSSFPSSVPSSISSLKPSLEPSSSSSAKPSDTPSLIPSYIPSTLPTTDPTRVTSGSYPSSHPSDHPSNEPSSSPSTTMLVFINDNEIGCMKRDDDTNIHLLNSTIIKFNYAIETKPIVSVNDTIISQLEKSLMEQVGDQLLPCLSDGAEKSESFGTRQLNRAAIFLRSIDGDYSTILSSLPKDEIDSSSSSCVPRKDDSNSCYFISGSMTLKVESIEDFIGIESVVSNVTKEVINSGHLEKTSIDIEDVWYLDANPPEVNKANFVDLEDQHHERSKERILISVLSFTVSAVTTAVLCHTLMTRARSRRNQPTTTG